MAGYKEIIEANLKKWPKKDPVTKLNHNLNKSPPKLVLFVIYGKAKELAVTPPGNKLSLEFSCYD